MAGKRRTLLALRIAEMIEKDVLASNPVLIVS